MAIFQKSVVEKFLSNLDESVIDSAYERFQEVYSASRINEIKTLKEEQYQEGFIRDIFVTVLGYTIPPSSNYNIELEKKNETDSKKADGAILKDGKVIGVIELKGNNTKTLDSVKDQAFGYKNNHKGCKYVISSNFRKLRFYIDDATEYEEFDLYSLDRKEFTRLFLFLNKEELLDKNTAEKLKEKTKFHEEDITKKLYKDYSTFKHKFFNNIVKNNPQYDKLLLFKKSQKFLDRILFLLFAEDKKLIPENAISLIVDSWESADDLHYKPLYDLFKIFFTRLNEGHTSKKTGYVIPAYNGGLFKKDEVLDNISVDDEVLKVDLLILSKYDFNTEVDVNILGHIFEHSLTELEEIEAEIKGEVADNQKSKRKKDGVFYTPKYITKYIVENTIGKLCNQKKEELNIEDFDVRQYQKRNGKVNSKGEVLFNVLEDYKKWLFELKIVDPACGSGAFLNQALSFLIKEHKFIDDLIAELTNTPLRLFDTDKAILEKNIFGVDINEESVEIAKLSLWLRTAQRGRKLSSLSSNIKCGNSLISDVEVSADKAFDWQKEFPNVFANGGFDVVIGNPPYVDMRSMLKDDIVYFKNHFKTASNRLNLFGLFVELSFNIMKNISEFGMIIHRNLIRSNEYEKCRELILNNTELNSILSFKNGVFDAVTGEMTTLTFSKKENPNLNNEVAIFNYEKQIDDSIQVAYIKQEVFNNCLGKRFNVYLTNEKANVLSKRFKNNITTLGNISYTLQGIIAGNEKKFVSKNPLNDSYVPILRGRDINRYFARKPYEFIFYVEGTKVLTRSRKRENFIHPEKILTQHVSGGINAFLDKDKRYYMQTINGTIVTDNSFSSKYILSLLNSKLIGFYYDNIFNIGAEFTTAVAIENLDLIPVMCLSKENQIPFVIKSELMLKLNNDLYMLSTNFSNHLKMKFFIEKLTRKLEKWYKLEFVEFFKELEKTRKNVTKENETKYTELSLSEETKWIQYFNEEKQKAQELNQQINQTDKEIDQMVYELYALTEDEIKIVEEG